MIITFDIPMESFKGVRRLAELELEFRSKYDPGKVFSKRKTKWDDVYYDIDHKPNSLHISLPRTKEVKNGESGSTEQ